MLPLHRKYFYSSLPWNPSDRRYLLNLWRERKKWKNPVKGSFFPKITVSALCMSAACCLQVSSFMAGSVAFLGRSAGSFSHLQQVREVQVSGKSMQVKVASFSFIRNRNKHQPIGSMILFLNYQQHVPVFQLSATCYYPNYPCYCYCPNYRKYVKFLNNQQHVTMSQLSATSYSVSTIGSKLQCISYQQPVTVSQLLAACYSVSIIRSMLQRLNYQQMLQCLNYRQHVTVSQISATCYSVSAISNMVQCLNYCQHVTVSQLSAHVTVSQLLSACYSVSAISTCYSVSTIVSMLQCLTLNYQQQVTMTRKLIGAIYGT